MKKKFSVIFIFMAMIMGITSLCKIKSGTVFADNTDILSIESKSMILLDPNTKTVLYQKNENERCPIASMCKIMTLLLTFEDISVGNLFFEDKIVVSENAAGMGGSQVFLEANAQYKVSELIKSVTVASANDASVALAEKICGTESTFVDKMNEKAAQLGMHNTVFTNCTGLPKPGQYSCAIDVAIMFSELIRYNDYFSFSNIWMDEISHPNDRKTSISNTNKLIRFYEGCDAGKTGYTSEAGHCLAATAKRNDMRLVSVIISAPNSKTRFKEASESFNYGFANYVNKLIVDENKILDEKVEVIGGKQNQISVKPIESLYLFTQKNQKRSVEIVFMPNNKIKAPIKQGDFVGKLVVFENGVELQSVGVVSAENVDKVTYFDSIKNTVDNWSII